LVPGFKFIRDSNKCGITNKIVQFNLIIYCPVLVQQEMENGCS
jgi:hypothetical protein